MKIVPRGAGTSLSGGAIPAEDAIVVGLGKFNRILEIDYANRCVVAQSGVTNLAISHAVAGEGFYYAPDPSSQIACTIGGNVAENSGGVHCLKYGLTTNNVLGARARHAAGRGRAARRQASRQRPLRSAGSDRRLRRSDRHRHRGHGADPEAPANGACALDRLRRRRVGRCLRRRDHRRRHHSGRHGDDGQAGDSRGRSVRRRRLSARRRSAVDRRARRAGRRGRLSHRARARDRRRATPRAAFASRRASASGSRSGPGASPRFRPSAG